MRLMNAPLISTEDLVFDYPTKRALFDINISIPLGCITALVGPNGAGKTTLINCLVGLHAPVDGRVIFDSQDITASPRAAHKRMGYLPDFYGLYDDLTVRQCLEHGAEMRGIKRRDAEARAATAAARLNVADRLDDKVGSLSRGLTQRAAIARTIIHDPDFLILDEPAAGLDPDARQQLSALFRGLHDDGMTLLVSSHILAELEDYCSDMIIIQGGRVLRHDGASPGTQPRRRIVIELAEPNGNLEAIVTGAAGVAHAEFDGLRATAYLDGGKIVQLTLLKHLVDAGLPVIGFTEIKERLQDTYQRAVGGQADTQADNKESGS